MGRISISTPMDFMSFIMYVTYDAKARGSSFFNSRPDNIIIN